MIDFAPVELEYFLSAIAEGLAEAKRQLNLATSTETYEQMAAIAKRFRDAVLSTLPESLRTAFPDYEPPQLEIDLHPADIGYLQMAFQDAMKETRARAKRGMTGSAGVYEEQVRNLKRLRDRILDTMPEGVRRSYPDYAPPENRAER